MMTGPKVVVRQLPKSLVNSLDDRLLFQSWSDSRTRATLIGNTHLDKEKGTYFSEALFVKAIQTENAVILLDELTGPSDAWNIWMTVLDPRSEIFVF